MVGDFQSKAGGTFVVAQLENENSVLWSTSNSNFL